MQKNYFSLKRIIDYFLNKWCLVVGKIIISLTLFKKKLRELLAEQEEEKSKFYLIRDHSGNIVGRINLVDIDTTNNIAEVGYRVGEGYGGKGIGAKALKLLLETEISVNKIKAKTTTTNIASQKVLEKNGFKQVCISDDEFEMNGQKMRFIDYMLAL